MSDARFHAAELRAAAKTVVDAGPGLSPTGAMICRDCFAGIAGWVAENQIGRLSEPGRDPVVELGGIVMFGVELGLALAHQDGIEPGAGPSQLALRLGRYILEHGDQPGGISIGISPGDHRLRTGAWGAMAMFGEEAPGSNMAAGVNHGSGDTFTDAVRALLDEAKA